ncbi:hypothetical protein ES692_06065 [Psychroserpens burtonensis]|uniref:Uncharacterized protein n=1 Tax=Psychroserpens burtonensis TaxID=49278 RepID=A0A5C7B8J5_9FLAO|nr:hypothetical protein [Psychroserpens burtonensis]TXE18606.1 hypothetical protein ES692_06065 [Psychroserpens burtonensis]
MKQLLITFFVLVGPTQNQHDYTHRLANMQAGETLCNAPGDARDVYVVYSNSFMNGHTLEIQKNITCKIIGNQYRQGGAVVKQDTTAILIVTGQIFE